MCLVVIDGIIFSGSYDGVIKVNINSEYCTAVLLVYILSNCSDVNATRILPFLLLVARKYVHVLISFMNLSSC